jgi:hypothetical protein
MVSDVRFYISDLKVKDVGFRNLDCTLHPKRLAQTLDPRPYTLNPTPQT